MFEGVQLQLCEKIFKATWYHKRQGQVSPADVLLCSIKASLRPMHIPQICAFWPANSENPVNNLTDVLDHFHVPPWPS